LSVAEYSVGITKVKLIADFYNYCNFVLDEIG
jgi:hypothetical protein